MATASAAFHPARRALWFAHRTASPPSVGEREPHAQPQLPPRLVQEEGVVIENKVIQVLVVDPPPNPCGWVDRRADSDTADAMCWPLDAAT